MIEKNLIFGIPVDYKNVFDEFDNSKLVSLKYQNVANVLLSEINISQKYIMSNDSNYPHLVSSNFIYSTFNEGDSSDDIFTFLSQKNWTEVELKQSYLNSFPKNQITSSISIPDYIIFEKHSNERLLHQILNNPDDPRIPTSFEILFLSDEHELLIYKINK